MPIELLSEKVIHSIFLKGLGLMPAPKVIEGKKLIACIGDSITFGAGVRGNREQTWEYYLNELLGNDYQVLNYGISGRTLLSSGDYPYTKERYYKVSQSVQADTYILMLGTNDAKPYNWHEKRFENEYLFFVRSFAELPHKPRVILMTPPQCYPDPATGVVEFDIDAGNIDNHIVSIVKNTAEQLNLEYIDLHEYTQDHPERFDDGVHPNATGNKMFAELICNSFIER